LSAKLYENILVEDFMGRLVLNYDIM